MNMIIGAIVALATSVLVAGGGILIVKRFIKPTTLASHVDIVNPLLGIVGTLFSVLLGFLVAGAVNDYQQAQTNAEMEANAVMDVQRFAQGLPHATSHAIREDCSRYLDVVVNNEWEQLKEGKSSVEARSVLRELWKNVLTFEPKSDRESNLHASILSAMQTMSENRRLRLLAARAELSPTLWMVILAGAGITTFFTSLFATNHTRMHVLLTTLVAALVSLNIMLLFAYSHPFSTSMRIPPDCFKLAQETIELDRQADRCAAQNRARQIGNKVAPLAQ